MDQVRKVAAVSSRILISLDSNPKGDNRESSIPGTHPGTLDRSNCEPLQSGIRNIRRRFTAMIDASTLLPKNALDASALTQ
jgi:hypothetical protein